MRASIILSVLGLATIGLAGCGGSSTPNASSTVTVTATATQTLTVTAAPSGAASSAAAATAQNLVATPAVQATLLQVGAKARDLRTSDFTGLTKGNVFYAVDLQTGTRWAGAQLVPSSSSMRAEVSSQDDGAYSLFEKVTGDPWQVYDVGLIQPGHCAVIVPSSILQLWGWPAKGCRPADV